MLSTQKAVQQPLRPEEHKMSYFQCQVKNQDLEKTQNNKMLAK